MKPWIALLLILATALAVRLVLVLTHDNYLGVDGGAYLLSRNFVLGDEPTGAGFPRPPLAPGWLLVPFTSLWGDDVGYKIWSAAAAIPIIAVGYAVARLYLSPRWAMAVPAFLAVDMWHGEMMVTGALPLLGFALIGLAWWGFIRLAHGQNTQMAKLALVTGILFTPWVNQTSAGLIVIVMGVSWLALLVRSGHASMRLLVMMAVPGMVTLAAVMPYYWEIRPNSEILHYPGPWVYLAGMWDSAWLQFVFGWAVAVPLIRSKTFSRRTLGLMVGLLATLAVFMSTDETVINIFYRSRYLLMLFWWPAVVLVGVDLTTKARAIYGRRASLVTPSLALLAIGVLTWGSVWTFHNQAGYSDMVTTDTAEALAYLEAEAPGQGVITNAFTLSLWASALNKVPTPHVWTWEPPRAYTRSDVHVRCVLGWQDTCDPTLSARWLQVGHILIDTRFPYYNGRVAKGNYGAPVPDQWGATSEAPWLEMVYSKGTTVLYRIGG